MLRSAPRLTFVAEQANWLFPTLRRLPTFRDEIATAASVASSIQRTQRRAKEAMVSKRLTGEVSTIREKIAAAAAQRRFEEAGTRVLETRRRKRYTLKLDLDADLPIDAEPCSPRQLMVF